MPDGPGHPDWRVRAAARVVGGDPLTTVADEVGCSPEQVGRWVEGLLGGGEAAVAGVGLERPPTAPQSLAVTAPVEEYLTVIAHELRTPLTAVRTGMRVLGRDNLTADLRTSTIAAIRSRIDDLEQLAKDVADAVAVASGSVRLRPESTPMVAAVRDAAALLGVTFSNDGTDPHCWVEPARAHQLVSRLLRHALRYGGPAMVSARLTSASSGMLLTVRCAGTELTEQQGSALFEPFSAAAHGDGNGLALYVVRTLTVASGGQVGVMVPDDRSAPSTVFWLLLPLTSAERPGQEVDGPVLDPPDDELQDGRSDGVVDMPSRRWGTTEERR